MFNYLLAIMACLSILSICCAPFAALTGENNIKFFIFMFVNLYIVQFFMYYPGSDVSAYAYSQATKAETIKYFGFTLSSLMSLSIIAFIIIFFISKKDHDLKLFQMFLFASIPCLIGCLNSGSIANSISSLTKMLMPFFGCLYLLDTDHDHSKYVQYIKRAITAINIIVVGQVLVCKISVGSFAAYTYYYEMSEEYFGFYNHPHSFTGLLSILSLYNIYLINKREHWVRNAILFICNFLLMWLSGVRTFVVALFVAVLIIGVFAVNKYSMKALRKYFYSGLLIVAVFGNRILNSFGAQRTTYGDNSSGRLLRWSSDLLYAISNYSIFELLFGRGIDSVYSINYKIFGVSINSLNLFVDLFLDYGIVGMALFIISYIILFKLFWRYSNSGFIVALIGWFMAASFINHISSYVTITLMLVVVLYVLKFDNICNNEHLVSI